MSLAITMSVFLLAPHSVEMTILNNNYRSSHPLQCDLLCSIQAQQWAEVQAARGYMGHGPNDQIVAYSSERSTNAAMRLWRNSPPHNGWLLSGSTRCGFGMAVGRNGMTYYAGVFK